MQPQMNLNPRELPSVRLIENIEYEACQPILFQIVVTFSEVKFLPSSC